MQAPIQQKFKAYHLLTAESAEEMSLKITPLIAEGLWQLYGPIMVTAKPDGSIFYVQAMMLFEIVKVEQAPVAEATHEFVPGEQPAEEKTDVEEVH